MSVSLFQSAYRYAAIPSCFVAGYALQKTIYSTSEFLNNRFQLPFDFHNGVGRQRFTAELIENNKKLAAKEGTSLDVHLNNLLGVFTMVAVREEVYYRLLVERCLLGCFFNNFFIRSAISTYLFALMHLTNQLPLKVERAQLILVTILGGVSSITQKKVGIIGSILLHVGFNVAGWESCYGKNIFKLNQKPTVKTFLNSNNCINFFVGFSFDTAFFFGYFSTKISNFINRVSR